MEVLKGEQSTGMIEEYFWNLMLHIVFCLCFFTWQYNLFFSFLFHLKDFYYTEQMLHDLLM